MSCTEEGATTAFIFIKVKKCAQNIVILLYLYVLVVLNDLKQPSFITCVYVKDVGFKLLASHVSILSYCSQLIHQNVQHNSDDADSNINITGQFG